MIRDICNKYIKVEPINEGLFRFAQAASPPSQINGRLLPALNCRGRKMEVCGVRLVQRIGSGCGRLLNPSAGQAAKAEMLGLFIDSMGKPHTTSTSEFRYEKGPAVSGLFRCWAIGVSEA